jgi:hypothetical protein
MMPPFSESGLIIRQKEPVNLETPLDQVDSFLTPAELFYVRSHFPVPNLTIATYRLEVWPAPRMHAVASNRITMTRTTAPT